MSTELAEQRATLSDRACKRRRYLLKVQREITDLLRQRATEHWAADHFQRLAGRPLNPNWGRWWSALERLQLVRENLKRARHDYTDALTNLQLFDALHDWSHKPYSALVPELDEAATEAQAYADAGPAHEVAVARIKAKYSPPTPSTNPFLSRFQ